MREKRTRSSNRRGIAEDRKRRGISEKNTKSTFFKAKIFFFFLSLLFIVAPTPPPPPTTIPRTERPIDQGKKTTCLY